MTEQLSAEEHKRRRRERYIIVAVAAAIFILTYIETHISNIGGNLPAATNIIVFGLININIILLILLVFLCGYWIYKQEHRRLVWYKGRRLVEGIPGARAKLL